MKSTPFTRLKPLVSEISSHLMVYFDKPFAFFGHSMGGLISFELARLLRQKYRKNPIHLFISGRRPPQIPNTNSPIHVLPETEFLQELRHLNGTPLSVLQNAELMQLLLPILRADFAVLETYTYTTEPPLECPITAFGGLQDKDITLEDLEAWRKQTNSSYQLQMFPGDHFFLHSAQPLLLHSIAQQLNMYS